MRAAGAGETVCVRAYTPRTCSHDPTSLSRPFSRRRARAADVFTGTRTKSEVSKRVRNDNNRRRSVHGLRRKLPVALSAFDVAAATRRLVYVSCGVPPRVHDVPRPTREVASCPAGFHERIKKFSTRQCCGCACV